MSVDFLIKRLKFSHGVIVMPEPKQRLWAVYSWGEKRDFVLTQCVVSTQPHEAIITGFGEYFNMFFCYPACFFELQESGVVHINSIGFPVSYMPLMTNVSE